MKKIKNYNDVWKIIEEWEMEEFQPLMNCIAWLNNDERVDIYNIYNEVNFGMDDNGMELILEEVEILENDQEWIDRIFQYIGCDSAIKLIKEISRQYDFEI